MWLLRGKNDMQTGLQAGNGTDLLGLAQERLSWLEGRQKVLARNVANANTPGYQPRDAAPFSDALSQFQIAPVQTNALHLGGSGAGTTGVVVAQPHERSLDGNAVDLEQQLTQVADTDSQQRFVAGLYGKYMSMFATALGKG
jgi:flagellar basal-body rod protein FlgB